MSALSSVPVESLVRLVTDAVASVHDPEYPDVSIADLGLVESITVSESGDVAAMMNQLKTNTLDTRPSVEYPPS